MGTDNIFHKRKAKSAKNLSRKKPRRDPYEKILIVCEGEKTEPNYFRGILEYYKLSSANIEITSEGGSSPMGIWRFAQQRYREDKDLGDAFDKVYCVFDKDSHASYYDACRAISESSPEETFYAITSVPCFEYWLLLHYVYTTKPYVCQKGKSAAVQLEEELKKYIPNYKKGGEGYFLDLLEQLEQAKAFSKRSYEDAKRAKIDNPSTNIHELVSFLQNIKR
ncbi:RloB family protein [Halomonas sp. E14]|uniref:RloB family protein n=1 Tax=Halomonas sp. E14 TaxID=3397245 RepID=UPI00403E5C59